MEDRDLEELIAHYGDNPGFVGGDGHEDDWGDLISFIYDSVTGVGDFDAAVWDAMQDAACISKADHMAEFVKEIELAAAKARGEGS